VPDPDPQLTALGEVIDQVRTLFHRLKAAAEQVHGEGDRSAARRGVLLSLHRGGPQTVPEIARARPVSRQHIQTVVNGLLTDGLVELADNPKHRRSRLVLLSAQGSTRIRKMLARERAVFARLELGCSASELKKTAEVLTHLREAFSAAALEEAMDRVGTSRP
jgi:DNA-binding MarR family transcriptional regulator